jgi:hypothetical protein
VNTLKGWRCGLSTRVLDVLRPPKLKADLRTGHVVVVTGEDRVEVRDPDGEVQVTIRLDGEVPTVQLSGARLEIESTDTVAVKARVFEVRAAEKVDVRSEGELELGSKKEMQFFADEDLKARAPCIWLN